MKSMEFAYIMHVKENEIPKAYKIFIQVFICLLFSFTVTSQSLQDCYPEASFSGVALETLCEQYGEEEFGIILGESGSYKASQLTGSTLSGNIWIKGDFYIDKPFSFSNAKIKLNEGVNIHLSQAQSQGGEGGGGGLGTLPSNLIIENSILFACENLWGSIVVYPKTRLDLVYSEIEDAEAAVKAYNASRAIINVSNTTFNRNIIGLDIKKTNSSKLVTIGEFHSNTFSCTAPINGTLDDIGFAGISAINTSFSIGHNSVGDENLFTGTEYGIYSNSGQLTLTLLNAIFEDLKINGIFIKNGSLSLNRVRMADCGPAMLHIERVHSLNIRYSRFSFTNPVEIPEGEMKYAIYLVDFAPASRTEVVTNTFENISENPIRRRGFYFNATGISDGCHMYLFDNEFNDTDIQYNGTSSKHIFPRIENNIFTGTFGGGNRIIGGDKYNLKVIGNLFDDLEISLVGNILGVGNEVTDNDFYSTVLRLQGFANSLICSNEFLGSKIIVNFDCAATDLLDNYFQYHLIPILLEGDNAAISEQDNGGNVFFTGLLVKTPTPTCENPDNAFMSKFSVHEPQSTYNESTQQYINFSEYHPYKVDPDVDDEFFEYDDNLVEPEHFCITRSHRIDTLDILIGNELLDSIFSEATNWNLKLYLFDLIQRDTNLRTNYSFLADFEDIQKNSSVGKYHEIRGLMGEALSIDSSTLESIDLLLNEWDSLILLTGLRDSSIVIATDSASFMTALLSKRVVLERLNEIDSCLAYLDSIWLEESNAKFEGIKPYIDSLPNDRDFIDNIKFVLNYNIDLVLDSEEISSGRIDTLKDLASLCPETHGILPNLAIGLLPPCEDTDEYDVVENCNPSPFMSHPISNDQTSSKTDQLKSSYELVSPIDTTLSISLYPNPGRTNFNIYWTGDENANLRILDVSGILQYESNVKFIGNTVNLDINLNPGLYILVLADNDLNLAFSRLVVTNSE